MTVIRSAILLFAICATVMLGENKASDDEIYDNVRIHLANDRDVKGGAIEVKVNGGVVELAGTVRNEKQRSKAEKVAKKIKGVRQVNNQLTITPTT